MTPGQETLMVGRRKIGQVFRFLQALNQLRVPMRRRIEEHQWVLWLRDVPGHVSVRKGQLREVPTSADTVDETTDTYEPLVGDDFVLKVSHPELKPAPSPPQQINDWIQPGWDDVDVDVDVLESRTVEREGQTADERFEGDPERVRLLANWRRQRDEWARTERPARKAFELFDRLYKVHGQIEREAEQIELVLGDGLLSQRHPGGNVQHPVLLQRLQLEFDPEAREFTFYETEYPVELYSALFRALPEVDGKAIAECRRELERKEGRIHPLGGETTSSFLRTLVHRLSPMRGEFLSTEAPPVFTDYPRLWRSPVIFMRTRSLGFASAIERVLEDMQHREDLPASLLNIVGVESLPPDAQAHDAATRTADESLDEHILLSKPANAEQLRIGKRLQAYGCVLVQGPLGTGKTHTIGNLVGHLLAQGKSILVTSHTTKALRRVREQVVEELRPLCVSVLESDTESRDQLQSSVVSIVDRIETADGEQFRHEAAMLRRKRDEIIKRLRWLGEQLRAARTDEYRDLTLSPHGDLLRTRDAVLERLAPLFTARVNRICWHRANQALATLAQQLTPAKRDSPSAQVVRRLREAVLRLDPVTYAKAFERLIDLQTRRGRVERRRALLCHLEAVAPAWAAAIRNRQAPHDKAAPPGDADAAWTWRQFHDELDVRSRTSLDALQQEIAGQNEELRRTTTQLIDRLAWAQQVSRIRLAERQDLMGWLLAVRKMGRRTGKRVPRLQAEARRLMTSSRKAVPVWIMPLSRVVENFDPRATRFDVVILDEASQSDVTALIALYLGQQVIIVGDDQQVSPDAVGVRIDDIERLIRTYLTDIPNAALYDAQTSVYNLAQTSFGTTITLREHFRCVPEIIQFSNQLCYDDRIQPLRDASGVQLKPHVVPYRVEGSASADNTNQEEALAVASLLVAAAEQPEYAKMTFGAISLVGENQAQLIETLLRRFLDPIEYAHRRIVCGNAAQFQGDERNVMFLSMVDGPQNGPLPLRAEDRFKKRFNVAASRAQDQMWVVYSVNPSTDLQATDLRRRLIEHALNPNALMQLLEEGAQRTESEFERMVLHRLVAAGYRVKPQWKVGSYRIDMVVEGGGKQLAVECDGDRYHPPERLEADMARQAILERLGWTFVRIRGSEFFRDPERAMVPVFRKLQALGLPAGELPPAEQTREAATSELKERVIRRAAELRQEWADQGADNDPLHDRLTYRTRYPRRNVGAVRPATAAGAALSNDPARSTSQAALGGATVGSQLGLETSSPSSPVAEPELHRPGGSRAIQEVGLRPPTEGIGVQPGSSALDGPGVQGTADPAMKDSPQPTPSSRPAVEAVELTGNLRERSVRPDGLPTLEPVAQTYPAAALPRQGRPSDFRDRPAESLIHLVECCVEIEGPVHQERVIRAVASCFDARHDQSYTRSKIEGAIMLACRQGIIMRDGLFLSLKTMTEPPLRGADASGQVRPIEHASPAEIRVAVIAVLRRASAVGRDEVVTQAARALGYEHPDDGVTRAIRAAVDALITQGKVLDVGGQLRLDGS